MKLFVGLGNPGGTYAMNRHNVGFMAIDRIHDRWNGGPWRRKFQGEVAEADIAGQRVMFLKPMTYMNESGRSVAEAARFYKVDLTDIVVAHDEIDLPHGKFRMKVGGGTGGHNGLKSISAHMRDGYRRLRIGIGHPGRKEMVPGYVLHDFAKADFAWLDPMLDAFADHAPILVEGNDAAFASKVHAALAGAGRAKGDKPAAPPASRAPEPRQGRDGKSSGGPFAALAHLLRK
ncbi:aminoacyl-tRNA hydrolase [Acuticoccus sp. 2012]|uniref:Peptidyl-tRNA hydrolase n=1 Tax=Acuticoccus mangrovi TaxID=2796142 RepID=A0A934MKE6_9HYPH|nr:aminoacyl-tRNA hydrolase [Acuticoccus mangrovi]MBJ3775394.1 aminoacyl-tRNA hydrolase [Acuticoccus mangrovi]